MNIDVLCARASASPFPASAPMRRRDDVATARLFDGYCAQGGLATTEELIALMRPCWRQPVWTLSKWIAGNRLVAFARGSELVLPLFQFVRPRMVPDEAVSDSVFELSQCMEDEGVAAWFIAPNDDLGRLAPIEVLASEPDVVVEAARRLRADLAAKRAQRCC